MSNSPLVDYTQLSPNHSGQRAHSIDMITPHCVVGQMSVEGMGNWFAQTYAECSCNYGIGSDGRVLLCVEEKNRSWCSSSYENDNRAVTIECASDTTYPYAINDKVYKKLIELMADICRRNGKDKILWLVDKDKIWNYSPKSNEMLITVHRFYAQKECPGEFIYSRLSQIADEVNKLLKNPYEAINTTPTALFRVRKSWGDASSQTGAYAVLKNATENCAPGYAVYDENGKEIYRNTSKVGTQASEFINLSETEAATKILEIAKLDYAKTGILASVTAAQAVLESGFGKTLLAQKANNFFGMKANLSSNSWESVWDGKSVYNIETAEEYTPGDITYINADFRKYPDFETSMEDHGRYLLGAMNGNQKRYKGLTEAKNYLDAITIIKNGGYATDSNYISKICSIIERYGLDKYDKNSSVSTSHSSEEKVEENKVETPTVLYRVRKSWKNSKSQVGAFADLNNAIAVAKEEGLKVFDPDGKQVYPKKSKSTSTKQLKKLTPKYYRVQIGRYLIHENATRMMATLKKKGFDAMIVKDGAEEIVQAGLFKVEDNANNLAAQIGNAGLPVAVIPIY